MIRRRSRKRPDRIDVEALRCRTNSIEDATLAYGIAAWRLVNGEADEAHALFEQIIEGPMWPAFGYTAAEAELARIAPSE